MPFGNPNHDRRHPSENDEINRVVSTINNQQPDADKH
jgi:hypothetical protein